MFCEIAITPAAIVGSDELHPDAHDACLRQLRDLTDEAAIVRDLKNGEWLAFVLSHCENAPPRSRELLKKLAKAGRLRRVVSSSQEKPTSDAKWCREALLSAKEHPGLTGIVTVRSSLNGLSRSQDEKGVFAVVDALSSCSWWRQTKSAVRLSRTTDDYLRSLNLPLGCSRYVSFIDPNLDPRKNGYGEFLHLVRAAKQADILELHRSHYDGNGPNRRLLRKEEWQQHFEEWNDQLRKHRRPVTVFLWPDFHDRYLITDLVGISVPYGFDVTKDPNKPRTTWCRLPREVSDDVQLEFDPQKAAASFTLGE